MYFQNIFKHIIYEKKWFGQFDIFAIFLLLIVFQIPNKKEIKHSSTTHWPNISNPLPACVSHKAFTSLKMWHTEPWKPNLARSGKKVRPHSACIKLSENSHITHTELVWRHDDDDGDRTDKPENSVLLWLWQTDIPLKSFSFGQSFPALLSGGTSPQPHRIGEYRVKLWPNRLLRQWPHMMGDAVHTRPGFLSCQVWRRVEANFSKQQN